MRQRGRVSGRRGVAVLEFGLLAPVIMLVLAGVVDIGNAIVSHFIVDASVDAAANFAIVNAAKVGSANGAALAGQVAAVAASANGSGWANSSVVVNNGPSATVTGGTAASGGTAANADSCYCPTGSYSNVTWGSAVGCGNSCGNGSIAGKFVVVTASYSFTPLFSGYTFINAGTMRSGAVVQVQ